jgi:hypothetical protein
VQLDRLERERTLGERIRFRVVGRDLELEVLAARRELGQILQP